MRFSRLSFRLHLALAACSLWLGVSGASSVLGATFYVDGSLPQSCHGNYSIAGRNSAGNDGDAYKTIGEAANAARAGDVILIRAGSYHTSINKRENDVLWPKNSGEAGKPITFRAYREEKVALGEGPGSYPSETISIARGVVSLRDLGYITIENLHFSKVAGWVFARNCHHLVFKDCVFADSVWKAKGTARFVECHDCRFLNCSFKNSSFDSLTIEKCERMLIDNCAFDSAAHAPLAIRGSSYNVIRNCNFMNRYFVKKRAEKLVEVYDLKLDRRNPANPAYMETPVYNDTRRNLFENNFFGYHPFRPHAAAQPSAIQYSGQYGIIRRNIFANPPLKTPDPNAPDAQAGGLGLAMRWGGSWEGWKVKADGTGRWLGEGHEAGYVTHNRIYNNVFFGYDHGCIALPHQDATDKMLNPPPMDEANPPRQFGEKFAFEDNLFVNNIVAPGPFQGQTNWSWHKVVAGKPVAVVMFGLLDRFSFRSNDFYAANGKEEAQLYYGEPRRGAHGNEALTVASRPAAEMKRAFVDNRTVVPGFIGADHSDFHLDPKSHLIDAGTFLTTTIGVGRASNEIKVQDANYFYDGFGIEGEKGDLIQLQGETETARITAIDYKTKAIKLDRALSWKEGQGVALAYSGAAPDIGAFERGMPMTIGNAEGSASER